MGANCETSFELNGTLKNEVVISAIHEILSAMELEETDSAFKQKITNLSGDLNSENIKEIIREDIKKKTADLVKRALLGWRGSEKLLNFHHLQMMKNIEGERVSE